MVKAKSRSSSATELGGSCLIIGKFQKTFPSFYAVGMRLILVHESRSGAECVSEGGGGWSEILL